MIGQTKERKYYVRRRRVGQVRFALSAGPNANGLKFVHEVAHHPISAGQNTDTSARDLLVQLLHDLGGPTEEAGSDRSSPAIGGCGS